MINIVIAVGVMVALLVIGSLVGRMMLGEPDDMMERFEQTILGTLFLVEGCLAFGLIYLIVDKFIMT